MDWSRAKTILIIALLLTNSMLIYTVYGHNFTSISDTKKQHEELDTVIQLLASEGIVVNAKIPEQEYALPDIRLTYETYENHAIIEFLLGDSYQELDGRYLSSNAEVRIKGNSELIYRVLSPKYRVALTSEEQAMNIADAFLDHVGLDSTSVFFWSVQVQADGSYTVSYRQVEEGRFVEEAYMELTVAGDEVIQFSRKWFGGIETKTTSKTIEEPAHALFRLLAAVDARKDIHKPVMIEQMDLGYRLVSTILTINFQEGDPSPYWRFRTKTGDVIYIEAQTK